MACDKKKINTKWKQPFNHGVIVAGGVGIEYQKRRIEIDHKNTSRSEKDSLMVA